MHAERDTQHDHQNILLAVEDGIMMASRKTHEMCLIVICRCKSVRLTARSNECLFPSRFTRDHWVCKTLKHTLSWLSISGVLAYHGRSVEAYVMYAIVDTTGLQRANGFHYSRQAMTRLVHYDGETFRIPAVMPKRRLVHVTPDEEGTYVCGTATMWQLSRTSEAD